METYRIESEKTKEVVFTSTWNEAKADWKAQLELLKKGVHPKKDLQKHFDRFGEEDLTFLTGKEVKKVTEVKSEKIVNETKEPEKVKEVKQRKTRTKK